MGKGFNWHTHLVHLTEKFSTIKSSYTFRIKCLITWLTQKQDFLFKEFLILSQKTQFLNRKHFRCPIWCPFLMHPLPSPPKKKILFYPENPPNFQMKTLSTSLWKNQSTDTLTWPSQKNELLAKFFVHIYIYIYIYIYPKKKFFKRKYFSHPLERTDVLPKRKNFLCLPKKITKEKISYNYQKTQSSKQGTNFPWLCKKLKRFTQIDFECCSAFFMLAKLNKLSDSAESYPTKTYSTRKTYKNLSNLQSFTKYLRQTLVLMWNNAVREKLDFYFSRDFY